MKTKLKLLVIILTTIICGCGNSDKNKKVTAKKYSEYIGNYKLKTDLTFEVTENSGLLTLLPSFWGSAHILDSIATDTFVSLLHPKTKFIFKRDSAGIVNSVISTGNKQISGKALKSSTGEYEVVELLLKGNLEEALIKLNNSDEEISEGRIASLGFNLIRFKRSKSKTAFDLVSEFTSEYPNSIDLFQIKGLASLLLNDRKNAIKAFQKAYSIDSTNSMNISALRLLSAPNAPAVSKNSWKLPFSIDDLFASPTKKEIDNVRNDWKNRDLSIKNIELIEEKRISLYGQNYKAKIFSHLVNDKKHFGSVLIPEGAELKSSPVVLELHGVNSNYSPFNISKAKTPKILMKSQSKAIIAIPSFRGNSLILGDSIYTSEGSAKNAWDGATDDAIAFLNVVLDQIPECDSTSISAFGKSRGGTVSMLVGIRDKRIGSIINWAGPSGWYSNMGTFGWTLQEQVQWALWERWTPGRGWGSASQFIDWFLAESIELGNPDLVTVRHKILSSSPLYFLNDLPPAQMHYGIEDSSIPISNAEAIEKILESQGKSENEFEIFRHKNAGHDQPYPKAYKLSREFLLRNFSN